MSSPQGQTVDLASLSAQQLSQVKKQLDDELEHLTNSFSQLRAAQAKFRECLKSIIYSIASNVMEKQILVPLTTSLYVPGTLADTENVIVDIGTGFFVEKSARDAISFYEHKVAELGRSLKELETIVQGKSNNLRVIDDVLRQKVLGHTD